MSNLSITKNTYQTPTKQQQSIIDSTDASVLVNAVAGSGKTSTLMRLAEKYESGIYLAFNKAIVKDVLPKLPIGWQCKTFNAFGLGMIKENFSYFKVNFSKYQPMPYTPAAGLATKHMSMNGNISDSSWLATCKHFQISQSYIIEARNILKRGKANTKEISGEDMLQYPIDNGWKTNKVDVVLVDECQDLNAQQIAFLACIPTDRIIFVGDNHQAIYGFRGCDPYALDKIKDAYNPTEYEITQSFRCPTQVLKAVEHIVPYIFSTKKDGVLQRTTSKDLEFPDECFIVSRTNNSLVKLAFKFIQNKEHFSIGSAFIKQLKIDLNSAFKGCTTLREMRENLLNNYNRELTKASGNKWSSGNIENKYDSLIAIVDMAKTPMDIQKFVSNLGMHSDSASCRKLMTIHAAKGLESEEVFFVNPGSCQYFKEKAPTEWEAKQEDNLYYVACTRALTRLTLVD